MQSPVGWRVCGLVCARTAQPFLHSWNIGSVRVSRDCLALGCRPVVSLFFFFNERLETYTKVDRIELLQVSFSRHTHGKSCCIYILAPYPPAPPCLETDST